MAKSSKLISTIGAIDELNAFLGIVGGLSEVQENLFVINSILSGAKIKFPDDAVKKLEKEIDKWEGILPVQKNFVYYGGSKKSSFLFYARALARRAERELVGLPGFSRSKAFILAYINRLSDYLFMLARVRNFKSKIKEKLWKR